jgi:hypothetical protein
LSETIPVFTLHQLESRISHLPLKQQEVIIEIHNIVASISPNADVKLYSDGVAYYEGWRGGTIKAGLCMVIWSSRHPFMMKFGLGRFLPDPQHLLIGNELAMRYYPLPEYDQIPWDAVTDLIKAAQQFTPTLENTNISTIIRETPPQ